MIKGQKLYFWLVNLMETFLKETKSASYYKPIR